MPPRPPKKTTELGLSAARERALRALGRREHSAAELRHKLEASGHDGQTAAAVVDDLSRSGWQSDTRYAEVLVRSRIAQGFGPQRIESELEHAGLPKDHIVSTLVLADADWRELAAQLHSRRFRAKPKSARDWQKQYRYLAGRGFAPEQIHAALKGRFSPDG